MSSNRLLIIVVSIFNALLLVGSVLSQPPQPETTTIIPPKFEGPSKQIKLPCSVTDLCIGGGGRYVLLHLTEVQKIAVFDVNMLKIVGYIPADDEDTCFAAGATRAVVVSASRGVISRWNLLTLKRELSQPIDLKGDASAVMGSATEGPMILFSFVARNTGSKPMEVDLETLKSTPMEFSGDGIEKQFTNARISANGATISTWEGNGVTPVFFQSYNRTTGGRIIQCNGRTVGPIVPTADGRHQIRVMVSIPKICNCL